MQPSDAFLGTRCEIYHRVHNIFHNEGSESSKFLHFSLLSCEKLSIQRQQLDPLTK